MIRRAIRLLDSRSRRRLARWLLESLPDAERAHLTETLLARPVAVDTPHGPLHFLNHGRGSCKRARRLLSKEPDTLAWIDAMAPGSVFWDVGANIGTLSLYAALRGDLTVQAFEPAAVNYYNLTANCELNGLGERLHCHLAGFGAEDRLGTVRVSQRLAARSFSFRSEPSFMGAARAEEARKDRKKDKEASTLDLPGQPAPIHRLDSFVEALGGRVPDYIKIDVPGMTLDILDGAERTLAAPGLRQLQVEAKPDSKGGRKLVALLGRHGFEIVARQRRADGSPSGDLLFGRPAAEPGLKRSA